MQIPVSVFICVHRWLKKEVKSTAKTTAGLDHYGCVPLAPYNLRRKRKEPRMNSDGRG